MNRGSFFLSSFFLLVVAASFIFDATADTKYERSSTVGDQTIHVERDLSGHITLSSASCDVLENQVSALSDWSAKIGDEHSTDALCSCKEHLKTENKCQVDITKVAPDVVRKLQGLLPEYMGPNCWNAALVTGKIIPELRYADPEEMTFWMNSPLCRELSADEKPKAGDIVAVRDQEGVEQHGFIYVTDQLAFSKNGLENTTPYTLESPWNVFFRYDVREGCQKVSGAADSRCPNYANFYECKTLEAYLQDRKTIPSQEFEKTNDAVCEAEMKLSDLSLYGNRKKHPVFKTKQEPSELKKTLTDTISALTRYTEEEAGKPHSADEEFLWKSLVVRLDSTATQLKDIP